MSEMPPPRVRTRLPSVPLSTTTRAPGGSSVAWAARGVAAVIRVVGIGFGLLLILGGLVLMSSASKFSASSQGYVSSIHYASSDDSGPCTPAFTYAVNGVQTESNATRSYASCPFTQGEPVQVNYDPNNPTDAIVGQAGAFTIADYSIIVGLVIVLAIVGWLFAIRLASRRTRDTGLPF